MVRGRVGDIARCANERVSAGSRVQKPMPARDPHFHLGDEISWWSFGRNIEQRLAHELAPILKPLTRIDHVGGPRSPRSGEPSITVIWRYAHYCPDLYWSTTTDSVPSCTSAPVKSGPRHFGCATA